MTLRKQNLMFLLFCGLILVAFRMHSFHAPLANDECNNILIASQLLDGSQLYVDAWDSQPPGVFGMFMGAIAIFGKSEAVFRWLATGFSLVSLVLLFGIARPLFGKQAGYTAALLWAILSSDPGTMGWGCHREVYMNTFILASIWHLTHARYHGRPALRHIFFGGFWLGIASIFQTVAAGFWLFLLPVILCYRPRLNDRAVSRLKLILLFGLGPLVVWMATACVIGSARMDSFIDAVFRNNIGHSGPDSHSWDCFVNFFREWKVLLPTAPLVVGASFSLIMMFRRSTLMNRRFWLIIMYLLGSYLSVCLPGKSWPHNFSLLLPPLILLSCIPMRSVSLRQWYGYALVGFCLAFQLWFYVTIPLDRPGVSHHQTMTHWAKDQGKRIATVTRPTDTIFAWDYSGASLCYYSDRDCASRYTRIDGLIDRNDPETRSENIQHRRDQMLEDLRNNKPRVILISEPSFYSFQDFQDYLVEEKYVQCGVEHLGNQKINMMVFTPSEDPIELITWDWKQP